MKNDYKNLHTNSVTAIGNLRLKKLKVVILVLLFIPVLSYGQQTDNDRITEEELVGIWKLDYQTSKQKMKSSERQRLNKLDAKSKSKLESNFSNLKYEFDLSGSLKITLGQGAEHTSSWKLDDAGKLLTIKDPNGKSTVYDVSKSGSKKLKLEKKSTESSTASVLSELHLKKQ